MLGFTFTFFSTALAEDRGRGDGLSNSGGGGAWGNNSSGGGWSNSNNGGWGTRGDGDAGSTGWRPPASDAPSSGGDFGSHSSGVSSDSGRASDALSSSGASGSHSSGVSYDASRNMMKLDLKLGGRDRHDSLESAPHGSEPEPHWLERPSERRHERDEVASRIFDQYFRDRERRKFDDDLRDIFDEWRKNHRIEEPKQSVNPTATSGAVPQQSNTALDPKATSNTLPQQNDTILDSVATSSAPAQQNDTAAASAATGSARSPSAQQNGKAVGGSAMFAIGNSTFMPNEVLAVGLDTASIERAEALGFKADAQAIASKARDHVIIRLIAPPGVDAVRGRNLLRAELPGRRFELNKVYRLYRAALREEEPGTPDKDKPTKAPGNPSRCEADRCFAWQAIGWKETLAPCARGLKVGVIDTDIDEAHPAFAGRTIHRFDFSADGHGVPPNSHGTAVLSLLAGGPLGGVPGLIPDAEFFAANIFFSDERGEMAADTLSLLKALDWMKSFGVKLVNMSFSGPRDALVAEAIEKLSKKGLVFVAAAGNEGPTAPPSYPAAYPQVIAVTAVTKDLRNYRYANRGDHIDVAAPGVNIWTAMPGGRAGYQSGTSFAAPHVTAILAVEPRETLQQDKAHMLDGLPVIDLGRQGRDPVYGRGLLKAPSECAPSWTTTASNE